MKTLLVIASVAILSFIASAKTNTTRNVTVEKQLYALERVTDKDSLYADKISIAGYDKSVTDANESFFVTNNTPFHLTAITIKFIYSYATSSEKLHEETYRVECDIPSGETRRLMVRSFDRQHQFYYYSSRKPKRAATAYSVKYRIMSYDVRITVAQ